MENLKLTLLENAHDFMKSAVEEAEKDDKRYWKYAILNLSIGLELLMQNVLKNF